MIDNSNHHTQKQYVSLALSTYKNPRTPLYLSSSDTNTRFMHPDSIWPTLSERLLGLGSLPFFSYGTLFQSVLSSAASKLAAILFDVYGTSVVPVKTAVLVIIPYPGSTIQYLQHYPFPFPSNPLPFATRSTTAVHRLCADFCVRTLRTVLHWLVDVNHHLPPRYGPSP